MLRIEEDGGIAVVRIDRPEARNALNAETLSALTDTARTLGRRSDISAVILTGTDRFFFRWHRPQGRTESFSYASRAARCRARGS